METNIRTDLKKTLSLDGMKKGEQAVLFSVNGGRGIVSRLGSLGFTPGAALEMTQNYGHGPLVVTIRGTRVALGRQEARKIIVQREER